MKTIGPSAQLRETVDEAQWLQSASETEQRAHLDDAMGWHDELYGKARDLHRKLTKGKETTKTPWLGEDEADQPVNFRLRYLLDQVDGIQQTPKLNLYTELGATQSDGIVVVSNEFSAVFFRSVEYKIGDLNARGPGVSTYDGRILNEYGLRYGSPLPALRDDETLEAIEATLGVMTAGAEREGLI